MKKTWLKRLTVLALILCLLLFLTACQPVIQTLLQGKKAGAQSLMEDIKAQKVSGLKSDENFQALYDQFAAALLKESYGLEENKNILLSPLSVMTALGMTAMGARGETLKEMEAVLLGGAQNREGKSLGIEDLSRYLYEYYQKLPSVDESRFTFGNSIWFRDEAGFEVEKEFLQINKNYYDPDIYKAPFDAGTVRDINQWVDSKTEHLIPQVLEELDERDMMALINALLFDAKWDNPFGSNAEYPGSFRALGGAERKVTMMNGEGLYLIDEGDTIGMMKAYGGEKYRFAALMPRDEKADFDRFVYSLDGEKLQLLLGSVKNWDFTLVMPKFTAEFSTDLVKALGNLGMQGAFDSGADFSGISQTMPLAIGQVVHKTRLELDNDGTKAAAVTVVMATKAAMPVPGRIDAIVLDRPFVYMIIDTENQLPIFLGTMTDIEL